MKKRGSRIFFSVATGLSLVLGAAGPAFALIALSPASAPTLDEFGLIGLGVVVGVAGVIALFRRKK